MTRHACAYARLALAWTALGVGFNLSQRVLDYALDHGLKAVPWLAWLT